MFVPLARECAARNSFPAHGAKTPARFVLTQFSSSIPARCFLSCHVISRLGCLDPCTIVRFLNLRKRRSLPGLARSNFVLPPWILRSPTGLNACSPGLLASRRVQDFALSALHFPLVLVAWQGSSWAPAAHQGCDFRSCSCCSFFPCDRMPVV
jgi:hypothetical protein